MAVNPDTCGVIDPSIPQWKRELIIRRRALGRTLQVGISSVKLTCPAVVAVVRQPELFSACENITPNTQKCSPSSEDLSFSSLNQNRLDFHPGPSSAGSVSNMRLLDTCSEVDNLVVNNGIDVKNKQSGVVTNNSESSVNYSLIMGEDKSLNLKKKSASRLKQEKSNNSVSNRQKLFIDKSSNEGSNGKSSKDEDCLSDSSEELQYGPGIVNKLKTKYLSMTLREQKRNSRPSLANLRRATSLENMLEGDDNINEQAKTISPVKVKPENVSLNDRTNLTRKTTGLISNRSTRSCGNHRLETMKRAQSMDTLLKSEVRATIKPIVNENIVIVEKENLESKPPPDASTRLRRDVNTELPPPDLVKQTLKIFETSPKRKAKPAGQGNLAKLVAGFSNQASQPVSSLSNRSIERRKVNQNSKPTLSPKPILSPEKLKRTKVGSPKRNQPVVSSVQTANRILTSSPVRPTGINERVKPQSTPSEQSVSERKAVTSPKVLSPRCVSPIVTVLTENDHPTLASTLNDKLHPQNLAINGDKEISTDPEELDEVEGISESSKPVPESALENIRRGGVSMQFSFNREDSESLNNKSYLPRSKSPPQALNTSLLKEKLEKSSPPSPFVATRQQGSPQTKQVGIIRPLVSAKIQSSISSAPALTEQEIEKNLINRVKSIEQPISKVVVAIKALPDNVVLGSVSSDVVTNKSVALSQGCAGSKVKNQGLWDEKIWHANQNTIVFNFSNRKEVPDYIENDGLILRGKRERPRPGDSGFILLGGGGDADDSSTEAEELLTSAPPSPCDVTFVGDNVLINGKSNLKKAAKTVKLRIQFNDEATTMFEYPSEASLVAEEVAEAAAMGRGRDEGDVAQASSATATPGSSGLAMNLGIPPPDFLPPPVPSRPLPPPPVDQCPPLPLVLKARAPQPPRLLCPVEPPVPPRSPPRLHKTRSLDAGSSNYRKPIAQSSISGKGGKEKYFSMKKKKAHKPTNDTFKLESTNVDVPFATTESATEVEKSLNYSENQVDVDNQSEIPTTHTTSFTEPNNNTNCLDLTEQSESNLATHSSPFQSGDISLNESQVEELENYSSLENDFSVSCAINQNLGETALSNVEEHQSFEVSENVGAYLLPTQSSLFQPGDISLNKSQVEELENYNSLENEFSISFDINQNHGKTALPDLEKHQSLEVPENASAHVDNQKDPNNSFDVNANNENVISKSPSQKSDVISNKLSLKLNTTKVALNRPVIDLTKNTKPVKIVQPFMGTKSLPSTLLGSSDVPSYRPVYSKPSLVRKNSELAVDPILSQVLTQKRIPSPTFVNRSLSTDQVLVLEDWPLGTESLV